MEMDKYHDATESLIKILNGKFSPSSQGEVLPMHEWMSKVTLDIICTTAFSYTTYALHDPHNDLAQAYERMIEFQNGVDR
ncbi:hypothetical protein P691DRAFT_761785 [Macrolepiota fuliginosa MF-IS2]|uniref:Uncharacterized protein n=1 Tax=Macrolepiota fuliginosa MF-IS2 TaxID=1400762 RepID=A0A9P5XAY4_9AGAR|nr:hypothetical protein P691DRAFT_761785 [Macrolepiota fuliginosa MF-IS2]